MIGAISYYNYTSNDEQQGHFVFWRRNYEKNGWIKISDSNISFFDSFDEQFENLILILMKIK